MASRDLLRCEVWVTGEHIQVELVELANLKKTLDEYCARDGYTVDARLMHLAFGIAL